MNPLGHNSSKALVEVILAHAKVLGVDAANIDIEVESGSASSAGGLDVEGLDAQGKPATGIAFLNFRYTASLYIDTLPSRSVPLLLLLVQTQITKDENRERLALQDPKFLFQKESEDHTGVVITAEFNDTFHLKEDPDGLLELGGKRYSPGDYALFIAEHGTVEHGRT
ncbi:MAG: hypothetical protein RL095_2173 [Verrucomicrobiota bacterium]|jgi:hypothetical protein